MLLKKLPTTNIISFIEKNNMTIRVIVKSIVEVIFFFRYHTNLLYTQLTDISTVDYLERKYRFEVYYNLRSIKFNTRLFITTMIPEATTVTSITNLYPNSN